MATEKINIKINIKKNKEIIFKKNVFKHKCQKH